MLPGMEQFAPARTPPRFCTLDEYFRLDDASPERLEYRGDRAVPLGGEVVAMAGGTEAHGLIIANINGAAWARLRGTPCRYYSTEFRIGVAGYPTYTYADGLVICGPTQHDARDPTNRTATNPTVVVEVLSPSTEGYDRGGKFIRYMGAPSCKEYVLVAQDQPWVHVFHRQPDGTWLMTPYAGLDVTVKLRSIGVELPMSEIYLNVTFPASTADASEPA